MDLSWQEVFGLFAQALKAGAEVAYGAVSKPQEGTMLTVARMVAEHAVSIRNKHKDFELYGKYLFKENKVELPKDDIIIKNNIKYLKNKFISDKLVDYRLDYLNNEFVKFNKLKFNELVFKHNYKLFSKKELDKIFDNCVDMILTKMTEVYNIK